MNYWFLKQCLYITVIQWKLCASREHRKVHYARHFYIPIQIKRRLQRRQTWMYCTLIRLSIFIRFCIKSCYRNALGCVRSLGRLPRPSWRSATGIPRSCRNALRSAQSPPAWTSAPAPAVLSDHRRALKREIHYLIIITRAGKMFIQPS